MRRFIISEQSMAPDLAPGDRILARRMRQPSRGAVVFFEHPERPAFWLVKRLIGLPGEEVTIRAGEVRINGESLSEPWAKGATRPEGAWRVAPEHMFVLSDAREATRADSRTLGAVTVEGAFRAGWRYRRATT